MDSKELKRLVCQDEDNKSKTMNTIKALILDFDRTLFNTDADIEVRKNKKGSELIWDEVFAVIPQYRLYDGWREVFAWCKDNSIKIGIVSTAKKVLIERTLNHFGLECNVIVGWQMFFQKPHKRLVEMALKKLKVDKENVISIGDSVKDRDMSSNGEVRFVGAVWDSTETDELRKGEVVENPLDIIDILI